MKRQRRLSSIRLCVFLGGVIQMTSGCQAEMREYNLQALSPPRIPLRVGLYMSPVFRTYRAMTYGAGGEYLGGGMTKGAEQAARQAFEEVVIIDSLSSAEIPRRGIEAIASPEIVKAGAVVAGPFRSATYEITCQWTIWSLDGKVVYQNAFTGAGTDNSFSARTTASNMMTLAAKEQYDKFLVHVVSNKWWEAIK